MLFKSHRGINTFLEHRCVPYHQGPVPKNAGANL
jgi:hypothetical protein